MSVFNVGQQVECVYRKGNGQGCLANLDLTNTIFVGHTRALDSSADTIPPLGSIIVDGSQDIYASTQSQAVIVRLQSTPGVTNWAPSPAQVAAQINALGLATSANQQTTQTTLTSGIALPVGAAQEAGNLQTAKQLLAGTSTGALVSGAGRTVGQEVAALIASGSAAGTPGGTPLLHGYNILQNPPNSFHSIAANSTFTLGTYAIAKPGYLIAINLGMSGSNKYCIAQVNMSWQDASTGTVLATEIWYLWANNTTTAQVIGKGPTKGNQLVITVQNRDTAQALSIFWSLSETTHHIARDDWRGNVITTVPYGSPQAGTPTTDAFSLLLAEVATVAVPNLTTQKYVLPTYAGQAYLAANGSAGVSVVTIATWSPVAAAEVVLFQFSFSAAFDTNQAITLPRGANLLEITNDSGAAANYGFALTSQEYAS